MRDRSHQAIVWLAVFGLVKASAECSNHSMNDMACRRARARVEARLAFYRHATIYVFVNIFLATLNLTRQPDHLWFQWPLLGWGIGLLSHGVSVFSYRWNSARKEQMIQREMEREARSRPASGS